MLPPITALAAVSWAGETTSGSRAAAAGPKNPSAQPYPAAMASSSPNGGAPVSKAPASTPAAAVRASSDTVITRARGNRSPASPPASVTSRAVAACVASTSPRRPAEPDTRSTAKLSVTGRNPSAVPEITRASSTARMRRAPRKVRHDPGGFPVL